MSDRLFRLACAGAAARRAAALRRARRAAELRAAGLTRAEIAERLALEEERRTLTGGLVPYTTRTVSRLLRRADA